MDEFFIYADLYDNDMFHLMKHTIRFHSKTVLKYHLAALHHDTISDLIPEPGRSSILDLGPGEKIKVNIEIREA